jgi:hypothetical protein
MAECNGGFSDAQLRGKSNEWRKFRKEAAKDSDTGAGLLPDGLFSNQKSHFG